MLTQFGQGDDTIRTKRIRYCAGSRGLIRFFRVSIIELELYAKIDPARRRDNITDWWRFSSLKAVSYVSYQLPTDRLPHAPIGFLSCASNQPRGKDRSRGLIRCPIHH